MPTTSWRNNISESNPRPWEKEPVMMSEEEKAKYVPADPNSIPVAALSDADRKRFVAAGLLNDPGRVKTQEEIEAEGRAACAGGTRIPSSAKCGVSGSNYVTGRPESASRFACPDCTRGHRAPSCTGACFGWYEENR
jgi:hypothetical protein